LEPYRESFKKLFSKNVSFIETYMASEGSFGFQAKPGGGIKLVLNSGVFYEFAEFNRENFDEDGNPNQHLKTVMVHEVKQDVDYVILISTCSGAWRYIIGDVISFTNAKEYEIKIVGRTKQFLSLCGEHLSIDNMNKAIDLVSKKLNITIREFAVTGLKHQNRFAHQWYIGCDDKHVDNQMIKQLLDETLCQLNDDYEVERTSALTEVFVEVLPSEVFINYMRSKGKVGAMNKFPRVLKNGQYTDWANYLTNSGIMEQSHHQ